MCVCVCVCVCVHILRTAIEVEWTNIPQATINNLIKYVKEMLHYVRQMVVTPDTDWFSDLEFWPTILYNVAPVY